ncbi:MAG TPA: ATPase, T2SS/T4P/T4SS family, partial [Tepidisphaeraceae bacterium]|nr:ATPase, T2SS/T4P/T4SS family [Tepidisphaeraceae bacterium]
MFGRKATSTEADVQKVAAPNPAGGGDPVSDFQSLWEPKTTSTGKKSVEDLLLERGQINEEQLDQARKVAAQTPGKTLPQILLTMNAASEAQILSALAETLGMPYEVPEKAKIEEEAFNHLPLEYVRKNNVLPMRIEGKTLVIGMSDPANVFLFDEIRRKVKRDVRAVAVAGVEIAKVVEQLTAGSSDVKVDEIIADMSEDDVQVVKEADDEVTDLEKIGSESPVIRFVNYLLFDALKQGASDIHIEPKEKALKIRYRIDGVLFEAMNPPHAMQASVISRLKIMSNLDISERRLPQDGRIRAMIHGRKIDLRVSTLPTPYGEKCVMRILDNKSISVQLEDLGFGDDALTIWKRQIDQPHGIILVTGPTGSGKTTTLYSSLRCMDGNKLNISTVEDPIEYHLAQANQVQVHDKIGMSFAAALRSLLRQDPDV